ncbi:hypothetical protein Sa4125_30410 [Aureimonas sp. SA4125]|uniref:hypothetical protein n=1 Tax=Aureimonas sp. SA4125 TaxID=2826993 RepID=UPI001CC5E005|nr:hypothetical protein [Aureimonas sp. SA4125]BDA85499.1 hypothetical protein Sa4125_30410 [Aureimonas sp. SA4125]
MAFTNPNQVNGSLLATGAITAIVGHNLTMGLLDGMRAARAQRADNAAMAAWDHALGEARHSAGQMTNLAKAAVGAALDAQDEAEALRAEVARLRRAVDQRDNVIRSLAV